jgi:hypothetical protein
VVKKAPSLAEKASAPTLPVPPVTKEAPSPALFCDRSGEKNATRVASGAIAGEKSVIREGESVVHEGKSAQTDGKSPVAPADCAFVARVSEAHPG